MFKKLLLTVGALAAACALALAVGLAAEPESGLHAVAADSPCPAVGCASGECHGFDDVPEPDGIHEMACPEAGCASAECHAWDTLMGRYHQASDASLNVWILAPVALVVGLIALVGGLSRSGKRGRAGQSGEAPAASEGIDGEGARNER